MKRIPVISALLMILGMVSAAYALADVKQYEIASDANAYYECIDYAGEIPDVAQEAFAGLAQEGDVILGSTFYATWYKNEPGILQSQKALMLVWRSDKMLVMGACWKDGMWEACIESDSFIPQDAQVQITTQARYYIDTQCDAYPAIVIGNEAYRLQIDEAGRIRISDYIRTEPDGSKVTIKPLCNGFIYRHTMDGEELESLDERGVSPDRLCAWTMDSFPKSTDEIQRYILAHPVMLGENEAILHGGNFRLEPTSASKSMGKYSANARILGTQMGAKWPWYHVQVGHLTGWVSGNYVTTSPEDEVHYYGSRSGVWRAARAEGDISLRALPEGEIVRMIPDGTMMHIIIENDGWAHVVIPRGEITWETDWDGTYGFVRSEEIVTGVSIADIKWK